MKASAQLIVIGFSETLYLGMIFHFSVTDASTETCVWWTLIS